MARAWTTATAALALSACTLIAPLDGLSGGRAPDDGGAPPDADAHDAGADTLASDASNDALAAADARDAASSIDAADAGVSYSTVILADRPIAYWRLGETSGTVARDSSGNGNDAQYVGNVTLGASGALIAGDRAVTLDGTSGHVDAGDKLAFAGNAPMSIEVWAKPSSLTTTYSRLVSREADAGVPREGYLVFMRIPSSDPLTVSFERWSAGTQEICATSTAIVQSAWHHVVATYDGMQSVLYYDDNVVSTQPAPAAIGTFSAPFLIGMSNYDGSYFAGSVDEVAVYGAALTKARVDAHWKASGR